LARAQLQADLQALAEGGLSEAELLAHIDQLIAAGAASPTAIATALDALPFDQRMSLRAALTARLRAPAPSGREPADPEDSEDPTLFTPQPAGRILREGELIKGRFRLEVQLGAGGMGTVWKALDLRQQEARDRNPYVAIKLLSESFRRHPDSMVALQREAKKAQRLAHDNIIRVYDFDRDGDLTYLVMEYLSGRSLDRIIKQPGFAGLPVATAWPIIKQAADALACAHRVGIVHSDFKPSNVFIAAGDTVKVIDFGIARAIKRGDGESDQTLFDVGQLKALTTVYASPEMIEEAEPDPRDDIFALGCVTYELLTGRHPFDRKSSVVARDRNLQPARPPGLDRRQWAALQRTLAFARSERTPDVASFLEGFAPADRRPRQLPLIAAAIAVLLLLVGTGLWAWFGPAPGPAPDLATSSSPPPPATTPHGSAGSGGEPAERAAPDAAKSAPSPVLTPPPDETAVAPVPAPPAPVAPATPAPLPTAGELEAIAHEVVPCAQLKLAAESGVVRVTGYASALADVARLRERLQALPGVRQVATALTEFAPEKCQPLQLLSPFIEANARTGDRLALTVPRSEPLFFAKEKLRLSVIGPATPSLVYVDYYFVHDGTLQVVHMLPRPKRTDNRLAAGGTLKLGEGGATGDWTVGGPFGTDLVTAIAVTEPLPLGRRPAEVEPAALYLAALREALERRAQRGGDATPLAATLFVTTRSRP
jgi:serine/threonine protein kinase